MDGSDNTRNTFSVIQDFLYKVVEKINIGPKDDRVAVIQYSNLAQANFFLNSFMRKEDVLKAVRRLSHKGGRSLKMGAALQYVKDNVFTTASGSRYKENVPQILVVLNSGPSSDSVDLASASLKERNITILTIGADGLDQRELERISYPPNYSLSIPKMSELPTIQDQVVSLITEGNMKTDTSKKEVIGKKINGNCTLHKSFYALAHILVLLRE